MKRSGLVSGSIGTGVIAAIIASLCCIIPLLSLLAGASGFAATFSWMEPFRPYLIGLTVLIIGFAWFQKLKPKRKEMIDCSCVDEKQSFWQSKGFLGIVTLLTILMLSFPYYSHIFYPAKAFEKKLVNSVSDIDVKKSTIEFTVEGMTCTGCENHIEFTVSQVDGVMRADASHEKGNTIVEYDESKTSQKQLIKVINETGYKVIDKK